MTNRQFVRCYLRASFCNTVNLFCLHCWFGRSCISPLLAMLSLSLSLPLSLSLSLYLSLSLSLARSLALYLSLSHTQIHTQTYSHTHKHTQILTLTHTSYHIHAQKGSDAGGPPAGSSGLTSSGQPAHVDPFCGNLLVRVWRGYIRLSCVCKQKTELPESNTFIVCVRVCVSVCVCDCVCVQTICLTWLASALLH